jgi:hypothetical protein
MRARPAVPMTATRATAKMANTAAICSRETITELTGFTGRSESVKEPAIRACISGEMGPADPACSSSIVSNCLSSIPQAPFSNLFRKVE